LVVGFYELPVYFILAKLRRLAAAFVFAVALQYLFSVDRVGMPYLDSEEVSAF
jgi:hypothetical protein